MRALLVLSLVILGCHGELPPPPAPAGGPGPGPAGPAAAAAADDADAGVVLELPPVVDAGAVDSPVVDAGPIDLLPPPVDQPGAVADRVAPPDGVQASCPAPSRLTPADMPPGYLAPQPVVLVRSVDGDTAHFDYPGSGEIILRLLYVNTEESHGEPEEITAFGIETGRRVRDLLQQARSLVVVAREDSRQPGQPDLDVYDRWLGLLFVDGELFQTRLVREGLSPYYNKFGCAEEPIHSTLLDAEAEANDADLGIWSAGHPLDYRPILSGYIRRYPCRPDPFVEPYCG